MKMILICFFTRLFFAHAQDLPTKLNGQLSDTIYQTTFQMKRTKALDLATQPKYKKNFSNVWLETEKMISVGASADGSSLDPFVMLPILIPASIGASTQNKIITSSAFSSVLHSQMISFFWFAEKEKSGGGFIVNPQKVDLYSKSVAASFASLFLLKKEQQSLLEYNVKQEILRKAKNRDDSPLDFVKFLKNLNWAYSKKNLRPISEEEINAFSEINEILKKPITKPKVMNLGQRLAYLKFSIAVLKIYKDSKGSSDARVSDAIQNGEKTLEAIEAWKGSQGQGSSDDSSTSASGSGK